MTQHARYFMALHAECVCDIACQVWGEKHCCKRCEQAKMQSRAGVQHAARGTEVNKSCPTPPSLLYHMSCQYKLMPLHSALQYCLSAPQCKCAIKTDNMHCSSGDIGDIRFFACKRCLSHAPAIHLTMRNLQQCARWLELTQI